MRIPVGVFLALPLLTGLNAIAQPVIAQPATSQPVTSQPANDDLARLVSGVNAVGVPGVVGQIAIWGDDAFAIALGKAGDDRVPIIAAARLGEGRIIACAHGFASGSGVTQLDTAAFITNACDWLLAKNDGAADDRIANRALPIGLLKCDLEKFLQREGFTTVKVAGGEDLAQQLQRSKVRLVLCNQYEFSPKELDAIEAFIRGGGGLLCCACPWGWAQVRKAEVVDLPLNRLLEKAGIAYTDGTADHTADNGFAIDRAPGDAFNASKALALLAEVESGERKPRDPMVKQAGATLRHAAGALPMNDQLLRPRLAKSLAEREGRLAPTAEKPLGLGRPLDRALLTLQVADLEVLSAENTRAHPAAAAFPGAVADDVRRVSRSIVLDAAPLGWRSTGLYAPPGGVIAVSLEAKDFAQAKKAGLRVRIGCHRDELWHLDRWQRVPRITRSWPIDSPDMRIASAFGGPIYLEIPNEAKFESLSVTIAGGVEAPLFILGETTNAQWISGIRDRAAPWAELVSDRVSLSVPGSVARVIDDPQALMQHWVKVLDADADLAGIPHERPRPERFVADVQISAGYMHSGYPIMTHLDAAAFMTDLAKLREHGWGPYHELGHNHQQSDWTFAGTTEVTCNLFTLYVIDTLYGSPPTKSDRVLDAQAFENMRRHLETEGKWERWRRDPFLALQMYALMQREFGWDAFKNVFAEYRDLAKDQRPKNDDEKRDQWLTRFSRTVGRNLGPYFQAWGVPTSDAARASINDLPVWLPKEMQE